MLGWKRPRGVAPKRMPKAEATTGLAPKKASASNPLLATESLAEGFGFRKMHSLVKSRRSGGLGLETREFAGPFLPGVPFAFWGVSRVRLGYGCDRSRPPAIPTGLAFPTSAA